MPDIPDNNYGGLTGRYCPGCGYDVSGSGADRCAECGFALGTGQVRALDPRGYRVHWITRRVLMLSLPTLLVAGAALLVARVRGQDYLNAHRWFHGRCGHWMTNIFATGDHLAAVSLVLCAFTAFVAFAVALGAVMLRLLFIRRPPSSTA